MLYIPGRATYESKVYSVVAIKESGFASSSSLETVYLPQSITSIGANAFKSCAALTAIYYGGTKQEWDAIAKGDGWASGSTLLTKVVCSDGEAEVSTDDTASTDFTVTFITGDGADAVTSQTIEKGGKASRPGTNPAKTNCLFDKWVTENGGDTSFNFESEITADTKVYAKWISASSGLTYTYNSAKSGFEVSKGSCTATEVYVASKYSNGTQTANVVGVAANAFNGATNITKVHLPQGIKSIGNSGFAACTSLTTIYFGGTVAQWEDYTALTLGSGWYSGSNNLTIIQCSDGTSTRL